MADEKNAKTPSEESNIDQINRTFNSENDSKIDEFVVESNEQIVEIEEEHLPVASPVVDEKSKAIKKNLTKISKKSFINKDTDNVKKDLKITNDTDFKKDVEIKKVANVKKVDKFEPKEQPKLKEQEKKPLVEKTAVKKKIVSNNKNKQFESKVVKDNIKTTKLITTIKPVKPLTEDKMKKEHKENKHNKNHKTKSKSKKNILIWMGIGLLALILIIALIIFGPSLLSNKESSVAKNETTNTVAATVNGETIYLQTVLEEYNKLNPVLKSMYSVESILNKSIDEILLSQEAKNNGIVVKDEDIKAEISAIKVQNSLDDNALEDALKQQNMTLKELEVTIEKSLAIRTLLNNTILKNIVVNDDQIAEYYADNVVQFSVPEKVTVQHILVAVSANFTEDQAKAKIDVVNSELTSVNFCELVAKYTDDTGSIETCGTYTFGKGDFNNPEFENPSFDLKINETTIVKTAFGYHLIKKLASISASITP
jgi:parvulin-like peptidyl-prolyl isomerase